jgi:hypothetical protein
MSPQVSRTRRADATFDLNRRAETLEWLAAAGCPSCRIRDRDVARWLESFAGEHHADVGVITALRASRGFCASHTRALLGGTGASALLATVYADVLPHAAAELATRAGAAPTRCPACVQSDGSAARVQAQLRSDLEDASVQQAYEAHGGLCLPDALSLAANASAPAAAFVLGVAVHRLRTGDAFELLSGSDADAARRDQLRRSPRNRLLPNYRDRVEITLPRERLIAMLGDDCCLVCAGGARQLWEQLDWLAAPGTELRPEEMLLCAAHLHDLGLADPAAAGRASDAIADAMAPRLERSIARLAAGRSSDWSKADRAAGDEVMTVAALASCRMCAALDEGARRATDMVAAMASDPGVGAAFAAGHGICLRHAHSWPDPGTAPRVREITRWRLAETGWELAEARQKSVWWNRYETRGAEALAWRRAPEILDSWVYLGIGAPTRTD